MCLKENAEAGLLSAIQIQRLNSQAIHCWVERCLNGGFKDQEQDEERMKGGGPFPPLFLLRRVLCIAKHLAKILPLSLLFCDPVQIRVPTTVLYATSASPTGDVCKRGSVVVKVLIDNYLVN